MAYLLQLLENSKDNRGLADSIAKASPILMPSLMFKLESR